MPAKRPKDQNNLAEQRGRPAQKKVTLQAGIASLNSRARSYKPMTKQRPRTQRSALAPLGKKRAKENKTILVDGSNIAYIEKTKNGKPKVSNLIALQHALRRRGWQPIIIVDAALRHQVDDPRQFEALVESQIVRQAPAGTDADYFILKMAENVKARVVSNDMYQPYRRQFPWIAERRIPLMIIHGAVELYEPMPDGKA